VKIVDQENIWWDEGEKQIEILDKDLEGIKFEQKGYWLNIHTTHPVKMVSEGSKIYIKFLIRIEILACIVKIRCQG
jgi:hypothetical protein